MISYKYIGKGAFLPNIPARDLSEEDIDKLKLNVGLIRSCGLYQEVKKAPAKKPAREVDK